MQNLPPVSKLAGSLRVDKGKIKERKKKAEKEKNQHQSRVRTQLFHEMLVALDPDFAKCSISSIDAAAKKHPDEYYKILSLALAILSLNKAGDAAAPEPDGDAPDSDGDATPKTDGDTGAAEYTPDQDAAEEVALTAAIDQPTASKLDTCAVEPGAAQDSDTA